MIGVESVDSPIYTVVVVFRSVSAAMAPRQRQRARAPTIRGTRRCRTWPRCWDTTRSTPGCGCAADAVASERCAGGADAKTTTTTASRAPVSRSIAFGISAGWPRRAARPRTACSPGTCRRRRASAADRTRSSATRRPPNRWTRASGRRGTRPGCCACAAPTVAWARGRGSGTTTTTTRHRFHRRIRSSRTPNGAWNCPCSATTNCRPLYMIRETNG